MKISNYQYLLCSAFARVKDILVEQKMIIPGNAKVGFISNAADLDEDEKDENGEIWWVKEDADALEDLGYQLSPIDLREETEITLLQKFSELDAIFVSGGNTFYLLDCMRKSGFEKIIHDFINKGGTYISTSAGSCVAGPDIEHVKYADDPSVVELENYKGLNFCNVAIDPHFNSVENTENLLPVINFFYQKNPKYVRLDLTDQQAVVGNLDGMFRIVS